MGCIGGRNEEEREEEMSERVREFKRIRRDLWNNTVRRKKREERQLGVRGAPVTENTMSTTERRSTLYTRGDDEATQEPAPQLHRKDGGAAVFISHVLTCSIVKFTCSSTHVERERERM